LPNDDFEKQIGQLPIKLKRQLASAIAAVRPAVSDGGKRPRR